MGKLGTGVSPLFISVSDFYLVDLRLDLYWAFPFTAGDFCHVWGVLSHCWLSGDSAVLGNLIIPTLIPCIFLAFVSP
jgi:hypothetical protein